MAFEYLKDRAFLKKLDMETKKEIFVRISILNFVTEDIIAFIEGKTTSGSCNLSGTSNMRRTASVSLIVDPRGIKRLDTNGYVLNYGNITEAENLISLNKKVKMSVGVKNSLGVLGMYPTEEVIWFPLGVYVIKTASVSKGNNGINISLTLNDKCALLNGDMGGTLPAAVNLSELVEYDEYNLTSVKKKIPLKEIIRNLLIEYAGEKGGNILISGLNDYVLKVMKWNGNSPVVLIEKTGQKRLYQDSNVTENTQGAIRKGEYAGYTVTPFVYPGTLECNAGESVAAILDKIKNTLGNFEWFYDVDGFFHFQPIQNYLNTSEIKSPSQITEADYLSISNNLGTSYTFDESNRRLLTNISNAPQYGNIKNDFIVWGSKKGVSGADLPIKYHVAFDTKPPVRNTPRQAFVSTDASGRQNITMLEVGKNYTLSFDEAKTNHKLYYIDKNTRLYKYDTTTFPAGFKSLTGELAALYSTDWRVELYYRSLEKNSTFANSPYAAELNSFMPKYWNALAENSEEISINGITVPTYTGAFVGNMADYDYWLDFIEGTTESAVPLGQFNVNKIGRRTKVVTQKDVNCLFKSEIPNYVYVNADGNVEDEREPAAQLGKEVIQVKPEIYQQLSIGVGQNSAFDTIKDLLVTHTQYANSVNLSTIPIYYLEPNTRIVIEDTDIGVSGSYLIKSISLPLAANGTSSISATRCVEKTI